MRAFLYPGQGSQAVGMAADLFREDERFRALIAHAEAAGRSRSAHPLPARSGEDPGADRPAATPAGGGLARLPPPADRSGDRTRRGRRALPGGDHRPGRRGRGDGRDGGDPGRLAGGVDAGGGRRAGRRHAGGGDRPQGGFPELVRRRSSPGEVVVANDNAPGQLVLSGRRKILGELAGRISKEGLGRHRFLDVAGPWHGPGWPRPGITSAGVSGRSPSLPPDSHPDERDRPPAADPGRSGTRSSSP